MVLDKIGLIKNGEMENWYIIVKTDFENTGGYYILYSSNIDFQGSGIGYDDWCLTLEEVEQRLSDFNIDWNCCNYR